MHSIPSESFGAYKIIFNLNGSQIIARNQDGSIHIWDVEKPQEIGNPINRGVEGFVTDIELNHDGPILVATLDDGSFHLWDMQTKQQIGHSFLGYGNTIEDISFNPTNCAPSKADGQK
ncbi:MAG: hypothetical protein HN736_15520 [Anaerolineae bacterium]|jgi:WD40 repeat protein|nr:hypothetical protein [Anaerolineae bacterium]MBT4682955.1 hypothetical protein [Chloroflexota bacterium]MBT7825422.1 hypothetical protein [Bacteroidota bacterium]MBT4459460.1 hypothetical protein [Anaerolineae bacterium]MBT6061453.1 hypothetical protein [Anaerolineae bacterium]